MKILPQVQKEKDREELENKLPCMPWYVEQYINYKLPNLSPSSLLEYMRDYDTFFSYLMAEGIAPAGKINEIPLHILETLSVDDITGYKNYLLAKKDKPNRKITVSRKISALKSLFHYLSQLAEDENFYPLLKRNVMAKIEVHKARKPKETAKQLVGKLLEEKEINEFIEYIIKGYEIDISTSKRALVSYHANKVRDACIVSLILNSGLRVSETLNLDIDDIDLVKKLAYVFRKGAEDDQVKTPIHFRSEALPYLEQYLNIRNTQYKAPKKEKALFLALPNGQDYGSRMTKRAIQDMIVKYAKRFGKPFLTVHKLRHSFATDYYLSNDLYKTQDQLGHASPVTTQIYTHLTDKTMAKAIDNRKISDE